MTSQQNPYLQGNYAPIQTEGTGFPLTISGKPAVRGTLFRNGTNPQFPPQQPYHWFGGDGMVHGIAFDGEKAWSTNRWVRTQRFQLERRMGFNAFANFGCPQNISPAAFEALAAVPAEHRGAAAFGLCVDVGNTHVIPWGAPGEPSQLLALAEGGLPYRMNAATLETMGTLPIPGFQTWTAHPKSLGDTAGRADQRLIGHGTTASGELGIAAIDPHGKAEVLGMIPTPAPAMLHDMALTASSIVLPWFPAIYGMPGQGAPEDTTGGISWKPELGVRVAVIPHRPGFSAQDIRWFEAPTCHSYHVVNAFDDKDTIVLDLICTPRLALFGDDTSANDGYLARWRLNLSSGNVSEEILLRGRIEFPRIDERNTGKRHTECFLGSASQPDKPFDTVIRLNTDTGATLSRTFEGEISEPVHARDRSGAESLILTEYLPAANTSRVVYLNPQDLGVQGMITLDMRIPHGFHGSFLADGYLNLAN